MKVTLLTVVTVAAVVSLATAADPECLYRKLRGLTPHWPNPADCASYYRCNSKDIMRPIKCPEGKEYNPKNGKCGTAGRGLCTLTLSAPLTDPANICANEVNGAYLAKEGSCTEFYICSNQQAYTQKCDSGSYFNGGTECVPDTDDTCWENACIGKKDGNYLTNTASCRDYITCQKEQATLESCPAGSLFDANLQMCRTDEKNEECWENYCIGQPSGEYLANKDDCGAFYICYNDSPVPSKCSPGTFFNISGPHCQPGECPSDDTTTTSTTTVPTPGECDCANGVKHGQMVPNENNCRKFFTCNNGELVSGDCYTGNYFNPKLECCDRDVDNICPESSDEDCINGEVAANVDKCNKYYECCGGSWQSKTCDSGDYFFEGQCQPDTKNECPETDDSVEDTKIEDFMECAADEPTRRTDNCFSYLACMHGRWEQLSCRAGYYYDAFRHICKLDELNVCPENQPAKERARRSAEQPPAANCTCPDDMEQGAMTVHPTDCDKYLICNNGELVEGTCGQGNIFSTCNNICVPDTEGTCWVCANRPNGYQMADPDDCTSYYICNNGLANEMSCRASERYDAGSSACVVDVTGVCLNPCSCGTGIAAHPICNKYYQCTDGTPQVVECPAGQGFDATAEACSAKVTCAANQCATAPDGQTFPVAGDDNAYYVCLDNEAGIRLCPVNSIYDDVLGICLAQPALCSCNQNLCNNANINMPYPSLDNDNTTYCLCQSDGAYLKNCPTGYSFDEEEGICTFTTPCDPRSCIDQEEYHVSADYQDQNNFCLCRAGQPVSVPCPIGYTFSIKTMMCVVIVQPDPRCCRNYCVGKPNYETFPAIDIEEGYCTCLDDVPSYHNCPADKIYYDDLGICLKPSNIECNDPICGSTVCPNGLDGEALVAPNEPSGYCYCQNMCGVYNQCPDGKLFDQIMGICLDAALDYCQCQQCSDLPNEATFPSSNADDPTSYCLCQGGTAMYKTCGSGNRLIYDVELGICVPNQAPSTVCKTGLCAKQPENTALPALNTTAGFCVCVSNVPVYEACPGGATFDDVLCICINTGLQAAIVEQYKCDVQQCKQRSHVGPFAARDDATGFCSCEMDGAATYHSCSPGHLYEASLSTCIVDACDHMECRQRKQFEAFAAKNSTKGFCACDVVPSYHHCRDGYVFDIGLAVCVPDFQLAKPMPHEIQKRSVPQEEKVLCELQEKRSVPANCSQYELCVDGGWRRRTCAEQRYYNPEQQRCLEPKDDMVCSYARVPGLPPCTNLSEALTLPSKNYVNDCQQYFRCTAGKWRLRNCPKRHYYASELNSCLPMPSVGLELSQLCGALNQSVVQRDCQQLTVRAASTNCAAYLMCLDNNWWLQHCPLGTYFSQQLNYCVPNDDRQCASSLNATAAAACVNGQRRALASSCRAYEQCHQGQWLSRSCAQDVEQFDPLLGCVANDGNCQRSGLQRACQAGELRALPLPQAQANCSQFFYFCRGDEWQLGSCLRGHSFDKELQQCQPRAECSALAQPRDICLAQPDGQSVPHATDCTRFYLCLQGQPALQQSCANGSYYDQLLGYCRPDEDGKCQPGLVKTLCEHCLQQTSQQSCQNLEDGSHIADESDCSRYYICAQGVPLTQRCGEGFYFDAQQLLCLQGNGSCLAANQTQPLLKTPNAEICLQAGGQHGLMLPDAANCNNFYICLSQKLRSERCYAGYYFNESLLQCSPNKVELEQPTVEAHWSNSSNFDNSTALAANVSLACLKAPTSYEMLCGLIAPGAAIAEPGDCRRYINCEENVPQSQRCRNGESFDSLLSICRQNDGTCLMENGERVGVCSGKHGQLTRDPRNCRNYFVCLHGQKIEAECQAAEHFDKLSNSCQLDELKVCSSSANNNEE